MSQTLRCPECDTVFGVRPGESTSCPQCDWPGWGALRRNPSDRHFRQLEQRFLSGDEKAAIPYGYELLRRGIIDVPTTMKELRSLRNTYNSAAIPALGLALGSNSSSFYICYHAARMLGGIGDPRAVPALEAALNDVREGVRSVSAWALGRIGDPKAIPALEAALNDADEEVRNWAAEALDMIGDSKSLRRNPLPQSIVDEIPQFDDDEYHVLSVIFDDYWDDIAAFAKKHRLAMPQQYLGAGCTGVALIAGSRVMKILTEALHKPGTPTDDLGFARYLAATPLPGFARVYAVMELNIRYWQGEFLEHIKGFAADIAGIELDELDIIQNRYLREAFNDEMMRTRGKDLGPGFNSKRFWNRRIKKLAKQITPTWIVWLEKLQDADDSVSALAKHYRTTKHRIQKQLYQVTDYTEAAMEAFGLDISEEEQVKEGSWYVMRGSGNVPRDLDDIGQKMSWEEYDAAKQEVHEYLDEALAAAPLFSDIITSLKVLLDDDVIISDLRADNIGLKRVGKRLVPTVFDAIIHPLNP